MRGGEVMAGVNTTVSVNDNMSAAFGNMANAINVCLNSFLTMQTATNTGFNTAQIEAAHNAILDVQTAAGQLGTQISHAEQQQQHFNNTASQGVGAMDGILKKVTGIVTAYASLRALGGIIETADTLTNTTARVSLIRQEGETTEEVMQKIYQSAQNARGSYIDMASSVAKLGTNAKEAFSSTDEIINFTNLVQKQFAIAGATTSESNNAMLQLTQAMGSGVLRGDELNSIFENAPNLIRNVAEYMGVSVGEIREMASNGEITADIIKNAMFASADEINERFASMPMTWAQVGQSIKNQALVIFQPVLNMIGKMTAMEEFQTVVTGIVNGFATIATIATPVVEFMINGAAWIVENWSWISPIISGVVGVLLVYMAATKGVALAQAGLSMVMGAFRAIQTFVSIGYGVITGSTAAASAAQFTYNSALMACPLTWILILIIAVIAAIYAIVAAINKVTGETYSATGVIVGALTAAGAIIWNIIYGLFSYLVGIGVELYNLIGAFANFFANVFNDPVGAIINLFAGMFDYILGIVQSAAELIDTVLGSDLSSAVEGFRNDVADATAELIGEQKVVLEKASQEDVLAAIGLQRLDVTDSYNWGYDKGKGIDKAVSEAFTFDSLGLDEIASGIGDLSEYSATTADNTGKALEISEDNMAWMKDIAEREVIDRTVFRDIKVDLGGVNNVVNNMADLDGVGQYIADSIAEQMAVSAEGV